MKKIIRYIFLILYYFIFSKLPSYAFPGGKFFCLMRLNILKCLIPIGRHCRIMKNIYIGSGKDITIGCNCRINEGVRLSNVRIKNNVMVGRESVFIGKTHRFDDLEIPMEQQGNIKGNPIMVEDDVWIGLRVIVLPGVRIGKGCIIGAGAVVSKDTEPFGIYGGVPASLIRKRS